MQNVIALDREDNKHAYIYMAMFIALTIFYVTTINEY